MILNDHLHDTTITEVNPYSNQLELQTFEGTLNN